MRPGTPSLRGAWCGSRSLGASLPAEVGRGLERVVREGVQAPRVEHRAFVRVEKLDADDEARGEHDAHEAEHAQQLKPAREEWPAARCGTRRAISAGQSQIAYCCTTWEGVNTHLAAAASLYYNWKGDNWRPPPGAAPESTAALPPHLAASSRSAARGWGKDGGAGLGTRPANAADDAIAAADSSPLALS